MKYSEYRNKLVKFAEIATFQRWTLAKVLNHLIDVYNDPIVRCQYGIVARAYSKRDCKASTMLSKISEISDLDLCLMINGASFDKIDECFVILV